MTGQKIAAAVLLVSLFVLTGIANAQKAKLVPVTPAELCAIEKKLDQKLLPAGSTTPEVDGQQVFRLVGADTARFTVVPVKFDRPWDPPTNESDCGVYLIAENGSASFLWTTGKEQPATDHVFCLGIEAVGLQPMPGTNPALIVFFTVETKDGNDPDPYILTWNKQAKKYQIDDHWLDSILERLPEGKEPTIQYLKQAMSKSK